MRWSGGINHACKFAGVLVIAFCPGSLLASESAKGIWARRRPAAGDARNATRDFAVNVGDVVHFQEDSSALTGEAQGILRNQARWLNQYPQYTITIEGHADERGTREYNLALGARRAMAVKALPRAARG